MPHPEIRQRVMINLLHPSQPLKSRMIPALPLNLARRSDSATRGVQPHTEQQSRRPTRPSRSIPDRCPVFHESVQIQLAGQIPNSPRWMILADQLFDIDLDHFHLLPVHCPQPHVVQRWHWLSIAPLRLVADLQQVPLLIHA
jgi:hypothetical protein